MRLRIRQNPGARIDTGNHVLAAAKSVDTAAFKQRLATFAAAHKSYLAAEEAVSKADAALHGAQQKVAEADVHQDAMVDALAAALIVEGAPRTRPFHAYGFDPPGKLKKLAYAREAKELLRLVKRVAAKKPSKAIATALKNATAAAKDVEATIAGVPKLEEAAVAARSARNAFGQSWELALASLRRAVQLAENDGARGVYNALFSSAMQPTARRKPTATPTPKPPAPAASS